MPRPRAEPVPYSAPRKGEPALVCEGCGKPWPLALMVSTLHRCRNCARAWWREAQAAHRTGASAPPVRRALVVPNPPADVDAFLASVSGGADAPRRVPVRREEKHSADESIDSIVSRMGGEIIDMPLLPAPRKR